MSQSALETAPIAIPPHAPGLAATARLAAPLVGHLGVDYLSFVPIALMPLLANRLRLDGAQTALLIGLGSVASGIVQPLAAWLGDRWDTRLFGPAGFIVGAIGVALLGWVTSFPALAAVYVAITMGVGAFHPPAAAAVGQLAGPRRSIMLSVFFLAGMVGGVLGNVLSPVWVGAFAGWAGLADQAAATGAGLRSLAWLLLPSLGLTAVLAWATLGRSHRHADAHARHAALTPAERTRRWHAFLVLYLGNAVRFPVNAGLVYLCIEWSKRLADARTIEGTAEQTAMLASGINGPMQAAMQVGMGGGGLALGMLLRPRLDKPAFVILPILGAVPVALFPFADTLGSNAATAAFALAVLAGIGFGAMFPVSLSLGQRLLPHRTGLASGMLLGGAWCFGIIGTHLSRLAQQHWGLEQAFLMLAVVLALSGLGMLALPGKLLREIDPH